MKKRIALILSLVLTVLMVTPVMAATYQVKEGDKLWQIANELNVSMEELSTVNGLTNPNMIYPGQILKTNDESVVATKPKYVFMFIGDGLGASQRQIAEYYLRDTTNNETAKLKMNTFETAGINTTYSANSLITDSAAAGTALAAGVKTTNGVIAQDQNGNNVKTLIECAEEAGIATGLITTTRLTHATPAAFASHNESRNNENDIAADYIDSGVDFFAGGGIRNFIPQGMTGTDATGGSFKSKREDDRNLLNEFEEEGYDVYYGMDGAKSFLKEDFSDDEKVFATFTYSHMPYEVDRMKMEDSVPSLAEMTEAGIDVLSKDEDGFFMMIEGGRIDHAAHANDVVGMINDTLAFDSAIEEAYDFYQKHPKETLILVVGDHETGGLGLGMDTQGYFIDIEPLTTITGSIEDDLMSGEGAYTGDKEAFMAYLENEMNIKNLTDDEVAKIEKGMADADEGVTYGYYEYNSAAMAVSQVLSERANIYWTTTIHTGTAIPMSATGIGASTFGGYRDNTEISKAMAELLGFELSAK